MDELRRCDPDGRDGTRLPNCVKTYLPGSSGRWRMVFQAVRAAGSEQLLLAYRAFGVAHPEHPWQRSVYEVSHHRFTAAADAPPHVRPASAQLTLQAPVPTACDCSVATSVSAQLRANTRANACRFAPVGPSVARAVVASADAIRCTDAPSGSRHPPAGRGVPVARRAHVGGRGVGAAGSRGGRPGLRPRERSLRGRSPSGRRPRRAPRCHGARAVSRSRGGGGPGRDERGRGVRSLRSLAREPPAAGADRRAARERRRRGCRAGHPRAIAGAPRPAPRRAPPRQPLRLRRSTPVPRPQPRPARGRGAMAPNPPSRGGAATRSGTSRDTSSHSWSAAPPRHRPEPGSAARCGAAGGFASGRPSRRGAVAGLGRTGAGAGWPRRGERLAPPPR